MSSIYNVDEEKDSGGDQKLPNVEHDIYRAKMFLRQHSPESGDSLYDHLAELLAKILSERPKNAVDIFEEYSKKIKDERYRNKNNHLREHYAPEISSEEAKKFMQLYQTLRNGDEIDDVIGDENKDDDLIRKLPDLTEIFFHFGKADIGLPPSEIVALNFSLRKLVAEKPIHELRFWGKITGKPKNYYVVEAELLEKEVLARRSGETKVGQKRNEIKKAENEISKVEETSNQEQPMPNNLWKKASVVPMEEIGTGANKNIYYVCNSPGIDDWIELPLVTPQEIVTARQIVRAFTGNLETPIYTFPPFLGTEKNYLRAQIARISAATLVSPVGFFTFGQSIEDEEEEEDEEVDTEIAGEVDESGTGTISKNRHYESLPLRELIDPSLSNWCHHSPYILEQGRTVWWDPRKEESRENANETDVEDEEEEEEEEEEGSEDDLIEKEENSRDREFQKEIGPPLLTPLSEDASLGLIVAWTARASSTIKTDRTAIAILRSNIWPGSFAFATGKQFANVYIGMGQKFNPYNYSPPGMPMIQEQYNIGPEVTEIRDPSLEAEEAYRIAHSPVGKAGPLELDVAQNEDEEDEEDEDDEEDDDDDDDDDDD